MKNISGTAENWHKNQNNKNQNNKKRTTTTQKTKTKHKKTDLTKELTELSEIKEKLDKKYNKKPEKVLGDIITLIDSCVFSLKNNKN